MIKKIIKDEFFLKQKSKECTKEDTYIAQELLETIQAYKAQCVGMAANMIGYQKTMMVVLDEDDYLILINPIILKTSNKTYIVEEGCLSLQGVRKTQRYESIKVSYLDINFKKKIKTFKGYTAQIIQHELDHFEGKII
ncbi:peptide deformylase [Faecalibacillus faecis]|uniref:peptide deformylase n=1 Tax=Faecalibacillus faecis TaxID=1982628 RepID=UPI0018A8B2C1|nr:peptide deformylase [Faecalibacillus faecis]